MQNVLQFHPGGFEVTGVIGLAVGQGDALTGGLIVEEQTGPCAVIAGGHAQYRSVRMLKIGQGSGAQEHDHEDEQHG